MAHLSDGRLARTALFIIAVALLASCSDDGGLRARIKQSGTGDCMSTADDVRDAGGKIESFGDSPNEQLLAVIVADDTDQVADLLAAGADPNYINDWGRTALAWAAVLGCPETIDVLIAAGADVDLAREGKATALTVASGYGQSAAVRLLLKRDADPNKMVGGEWPLQLAAKEGHADIVRVLLAAGADPNGRNEEGLVALDAARREGHDDVVALLEPVTR